MFVRECCTLPAVAGALILLAACGPEASAPLASSRARRMTANDEGGTVMVTVPIHGTWDNTESPPAAEPPEGCLVYVATSQVGQAAHMGSFQGTGGTCVTRVHPEGEPVPFWDHDPAPPYMIADFTNQMTWVAADGDELWLRPNTGLFVQSLSNGAAAVRGRLTIAGGTGRFAEASGWMDVTGGRGPGEPGDHLEYEGEITMRAGAASESE